MSKIEQIKVDLTNQGFRPETVEATIRYNTPWFELARIMELIEQKKGVINRYGEYQQSA